VAFDDAVESCEAYVAEMLAATPGSHVESPCAVTYCQTNAPSIW